MRLIDPKAGSNRLYVSDFVFEQMQKIPTIDAEPVEVVAQMFLDFTGDRCPCNFNNTDEWLPLVCGHGANGDCPHPEDVLGCWKQYIKHYGERKDGAEDG